MRTSNVPYSFTDPRPPSLKCSRFFGCAKNVKTGTQKLESVVVPMNESLELFILGRVKRSFAF